MNSYFVNQPKEKIIMEHVKGFQSWLEIDLDSIGHNIEQVRTYTKREIIPCVKSNAYGHGIVPVVAYMSTLGIKTVLVAKLHEAIQLKEAGIKIGIISIDPLFNDDQIKQVIEKNITQTIYQMEISERLNLVSKKQKKITPVWIKIDTGLGRVGVSWKKATQFITKISTLKNLKITGIFSTLSEDSELDHMQVQRLLKVYRECAEKGIDTGIKSIASSNAVFHKPYAYLDATRPGLMLMGFYPEKDDIGHGIDLKQSLCWKARIEQVKWVEKGESLTYSRRFVAPKKMKVGTIHVGYYDGYPRGLTNKGKVRIKNDIKDVLGTVSVNHCLVDLSNTEAKVGDVIELISREGENSALNIANLAGIMTYSLGNGFNILTPRVYLKNGKNVALSTPKLVE
jgi:alanine racemase